MAVVRDRLAAAHGRVFEVAGGQVAAFPGPEALLAVQSVPGVPETAIDRLHAVGRAAAEGLLDVQRLRALGPRQVMSNFSRSRASALLRVADRLRAVGGTDVPVTVSRGRSS